MWHFLLFLLSPKSFLLLFPLASIVLVPTCFGAAKWPRQPEVRLLDGYKSPLDEGFPKEEDYYYSSGEKPTAGGIGSEDIPGGGGGGGGAPPPAGLGPKELPLCQRECLSKFSDAAKAAFQSANNFERYKGVCDNYNETVNCMENLEGDTCSNQETFHVFTSGLRYMCIEQRKAFEAVIECVDAQAAEVEKECEGVCHVKERLAHWAVQSGILDNFMQGALSSLANGEAFSSQIFGRDTGLGALTGLGGGKHRSDGDDDPLTTLEGAHRAASAATAKGIRQATRAAASAPPGSRLRADDPFLPNLSPVAPPLSKRLTPDFMRAIVQDGCELTRCQLICIRVKFDAKCGSSAGTLLSEAFVRPIAQAQEFLSYGSVAPFMGAFLPHQCDFMVKKEVLNEFRIPPELDEALHQKYDAGPADGQQPQQTDEGKAPPAAPEENAANGNEVAAATNSSAPLSPPRSPLDDGGMKENNEAAKGDENNEEQKQPEAAARPLPTDENEQPQQQQQANAAPLEAPIPVVLVPGFSPPAEGNDGKQQGEQKKENHAASDPNPGDINTVSHVVGRTAHHRRMVVA